MDKNELEEEKSKPKCTDMDHIYRFPLNGPPAKGTPCYCGKKKWGKEDEESC